MDDTPPSVAAPADGAEGAPLVSLTDKSDLEGPGPCLKGPNHLRFLLPDGTLQRLPCKASNRCPSCAWTAALTASMMLYIDAHQGRCPTVGMTLTTRAPTTTPEQFRRDVEQLFKLVRREAGAMDYAGMVEFTTGKGSRSGGHRRIHQHLIGKTAAPADVIRDLEPVAAALWERRTGATRFEMRELRTAAGAIGYLGMHHFKREQAPPRGWQGRRLRASKGYYDMPALVLRAEAEEAVRSERVRKAVMRATRDELAEWFDGALDGVDVDATIARAVDHALLEGGEGEVVRVQTVPVAFGADGMPTAWATEVLGPA